MTTLDPFAYFTVVPNGTQQEWRLRAIEGDDGVSGATPFTHEPSLSIADADPPANSNADRPWVLRSRLTLRGGGREASFHLDRSLTSALRAGDTVHIAHTTRGGLGVSVVRGRELVVSVGAVSAVPSGDGVLVRVAPELWSYAIATMPVLDGVRMIPSETYWNEWPIELRVDDVREVFFLKNGSIQGIHVFVKHGFYTGPPGPPPDPWWPPATPPVGVLGLSFAPARQQRRTEGQVGAKPSAESREKDECAALVRIGQCPRHAAIASAYLLEADGLEMVTERSP